MFTYFKTSPPFTIWRSHPHKKSQILITGGVDGDEYTGIKAAERLISSYRGDIPLTIIPVVNLAGNISKQSSNPYDHRFPKHIFPGSPFGSSSSRLMHQVSQLAFNNRLWLDLHGGDSKEHLTPFIWSAKTGIDPVDGMVKNLLTDISSTILYENISTLAPTHALSKRGIGFIVFESGELGQVVEKYVQQHLTWINQVLLNFAKEPNPKSNFHPTYSQLHYTQDLTSHQKHLLWYSKAYGYYGT